MVGWAWQQQGGYDLVGLDPHYRMVHFGIHLTQSETSGVHKLFPDKCRQNIAKSEYFRTTLSPTKWFKTDRWEKNVRLVLVDKT